MNSEQFNTILSFEISLLFNKLSLFLLTQSTTVFFQQVTVLFNSLRWETFINQLLNFLIDKQWTTWFLFLSWLYCWTYFINQSLNLDWAIILNISIIFILNKDVSKSLTRINKMVKLLHDSWNLHFLIVTILVCQYLRLPAKLFLKILQTQVCSWWFVLFDEFSCEGILTI